MSKKLRWGILGTAGIASELVRAIGQSRNGMVAAVASRTRDRAEAWAAAHGVAKAFGSYDELLAARDAIDLIYLPLPNHLHAEWTIRALEAGFPVLCEKPLTTSLGEARRVTEVARRTGRHLAEGFMYRFHPLYDEVLARISDGTLGELVSVDAEFSFFLVDRSALPASAELGGGALLDVGCYCVHLARWLTGAEPRRVCAFERRRDGVDDTLVGLLDFPNGPLVRIKTSIASCERHQAVLTGTAASLVIERPWVQGLGPTRLRISRWGLDDEVIEVAAADAYRLEVEDFVDVCLGRKPSRWGVGDAVANQAVLDALFTSVREGRAIEPVRVLGDG